MTVEELITKLQQIKNKKSQIKVDNPSSGTLLYNGIHDVQVTENKDFVIIGLFREN